MARRNNGRMSKQRESLQQRKNSSLYWIQRNLRFILDIVDLNRLINFLKEFHL